jgi:septal ring factor EnvC (AmiA/AmiB activator)
MRGVNFDYANTCPSIDREIGKAKGEIVNFIDDLLSDACPLLPREERKRLADNFTESLYSNLEDIFENTRETNEDMRAAADDQIGDLKDEIADLKSEIANLEAELSKAQEMIE